MVFSLFERLVADFFALERSSRVVFFLFLGLCFLQLFFRRRNFRSHIIMNRQTRSSSFDGSLSLSSEVTCVEPKGRKRRTGAIYVKEESWLALCCGLRQSHWKKKYLVLTSDRVLFSAGCNIASGTWLYLRGLSIAVSSERGHNGLLNCLLLEDKTVSFSSTEELRYWYFRIQEATDEQGASLYFYTK